MLYTYDILLSLFFLLFFFGGGGSSSASVLTGVKMVAVTNHRVQTTSFRTSEYCISFSFSFSFFAGFCLFACFVCLLVLYFRPILGLGKPVGVRVGYLQFVGILSVSRAPDSCP